MIIQKKFKNNESCLKQITKKWQPKEATINKKNKATQNVAKKGNKKSSKKTQK